MFPTDYAVEPGALARMVEERGFESLFFPEHTHIPASRTTPYPPGGELPRLVQPHLRPVRRADRGRRRDGEAAGRDRHLPRDRARPDHHREGGREPRPALRRAVPVRRRRRLEPRGDGEPRHRPAPALLADARAGRGDEGDLDPGRGRVPRRARRLRPHLVVAEAGAEAAPADPRRRQRRPRCSSGWSRSATSGCRTGPPA